MNGEEYGKKEYIKNKNIHHVRQMFRTKYGMHSFAGNYSRDRRFARTEWLCQCRKSREDENHLMSGECDTYGDIRKEFGDLTDIENLTKLFEAVLKKRDILEEEQNQLN